MTTKTKISENALLARINRKVAGENQTVRRCREGSASFPTLGRFYLIDAYRNAVEAMHLDLELLGRELGAIRADETLHV